MTFFRPQLSLSIQKVLGIFIFQKLFLKSIIQNSFQTFQKQISDETVIDILGMFTNHSLIKPRNNYHNLQIFCDNIWSSFFKKIYKTPCLKITSKYEMVSFTDSQLYFKDLLKILIFFDWKNERTSLTWLNTHATINSSNFDGFKSIAA